VPWKTLAHSPLLSLSSSPHSLFSLQRSAAESERDERAGLCAIAGPLVGARAPQRVSMPPSSGLAAALPWPSPTSQHPRLGFFSRAGEGSSDAP